MVWRWLERLLSHVGVGFTITCVCLYCWKTPVGLLFLFMVPVHGGVKSLPPLERSCRSRCWQHVYFTDDGLRQWKGPSHRKACVWLHLPGLLMAHWPVHVSEIYLPVRGYIIQAAFVCNEAVVEMTLGKIPYSEPELLIDFCYQAWAWFKFHPLTQKIKDQTWALLPVNQGWVCHEFCSWEIIIGCFHYLGFVS